ncbi:MAG: site-specific integrase [Dehalococcoidia bacterium]|nr:site-specific integrase [Dehalococcoidia bacterium]
MAKAYLEPEEVERLEGAATNLRDRLLIRLLFHLGCRISEALALCVDDFDLEHGTITILHLKTRLNLACPHCNARLGRRHSFCPECGRNVTEAVRKEVEHRRVRTLPVDAATATVLREYISRGGPVSKNGKPLIFGINRHRAWQIVRECAERAGLPSLVNPDTGKARGISPHRLRDAFAVMAVKVDDSGDGLRLLQEHLGHSSFNTTAKYRKIGGDELKEWYNKLWAKRETADG